MSKLLIVRHGQARIFTDDYDRLSELGFRQATCLGEYWAQRQIIPDVIYSGTLLRQQQTADAVADVLRDAGHEVPVRRIDEGVNEYPAEKIMKSLLPALRESDPEIDQIANAYEHAEEYKERYRSLHQLLSIVVLRWIEGGYQIDHDLLSWAEFSGRVRSAFDEIMKSAGSGCTAAVFTSGGPVAISVQTVLQAPESTAAELNWRVNNGSVTRMSWSGSRVSLDAFNDTGHLPFDMLSYR